MTRSPAPLRLRLDADALVANWRWLAQRSESADCGAAIKADGYGLGATEVLQRLAQAGCRHFFVATWAEAAALEPALNVGISLSVLHGVREEDMAVALSSSARPVINSAAQAARWREASSGACDVMIDTGINRLGLDWREDCAELARGLDVRIVMSHLACADQAHPLNAVQRDRFAQVGATLPHRCLSLANSAGIGLGSAFHFGLTRPGIAIYGGIALPDYADSIRQVATPEAQIVQRRSVAKGESVGYNATFTAQHDIEVAVLNIGYADGYLRGFSGTGAALADGVRLPVLGRVSMDLLIVDVSARSDLGEGDWVALEYAPLVAAQQSGLSQYEVLTGLGQRFDRVWG